MKKESRRRFESKFLFLNFSLFKFRLFVAAVLILMIPCSLAFSQTSSGPISFTKKEIAFFKWGDGGNEIGNNNSASPLKATHKAHKGSNREENTSADSEKNKFLVYTHLKIDGKDNVYVNDPFHNRVFVISPDGSEIRTVDHANTHDVDEAGDIISFLTWKNAFSDYEIIMPNGQRTVYKHIKDPEIIENGIFHDADGKNAVTLFDVGNKTEKTSPKRFFGIENETHVGFDLKTGTTDSRKVHITYDEKEGLTAKGDLLGLDDQGNYYVQVTYREMASQADSEIENVLVVYSPIGKILCRVSLESNFQMSSGIILDKNGNFFIAISNKNGVYIYKWIKN